MRAAWIVELRCSHACCFVLYRVACSCQQCFRVLLQRTLLLCQALACLTAVPLSIFFFPGKLCSGVCSTSQVFHFVFDCNGYRHIHH